MHLVIGPSHGTSQKLSTFVEKTIAAGDLDVINGMREVALSGGYRVAKFLLSLAK